MGFIFHSRHAALIFVTLFINMVSFGIVFPLIPVLVLNLGGPPIVLGLAIAVWAGSQFLFAPMWGGFSDRIGRKRVLAVGVGGVALTFLVLAWAPTPWWIVAARLLGGVFSSATLPTAQAYMADITSRERRGEAMAATGAAQGLGFVFGPAAGALLVPLGVRQAFLVAAGVAAANLLAVLLALPEPPERQAFIVRRTTGLQALFRTHREPWAIYMYTVLLMAFSTSTLFALLGLFLLQQLHLSESQVSYAYVVQGATSVLLQFFVVAPTIHRLGDNATLVLASVLGAAGFATLAAADRLWVACLGVAGASAGVAFIRPTVAAAVSMRTRLPQGLTMGVQTAFDALGRTLGPLWASTLYGWYPAVPFATASATYAFIATFIYARAPGETGATLQGAAVAAGTPTSHPARQGPAR